MTETNETTTETTTETAGSSNLPYKVVVIYSGWSLSSIEDKLYHYGTDTDFGMCRVDRYKSEETNRTICLMRTEFFRHLMDAGYSKRKYGEDFSCTEYTLRPHNFPKEGESNNLFISLPKELSASECRSQLERKLQSISEFGVFAAEDMKINLPMKSRENDIHNGSAFVTFKREMPLEIIALIKILLHDTWWHSSAEMPADWRVLCQCYWARERTPRKVPEVPAPAAPAALTEQVQPKPKREYVKPEVIESRWKKPLTI